MVDLSIIIVNWNTKAHLQACLESVPHARGSLNLQVIVVDNASSDGSAKMVRAHFPWVTLLANSYNAGFARGNNQALPVVEGRHLLLLNPDIVLVPDALETMTRFLEANEVVGAVSPAFLNSDGSPQNFYFRFPNLSTAFFCFTTIGAAFDRRFGNRAARWRNYTDLLYRGLPLLVEQPGAACLMVPRRVVEQIGFMDERFPLYFNDTDLCRRIVEAGYVIFGLPKIRVMHSRESALRQMAAADRYGELVRSLRAYFHKHGRRAEALTLDGIFAGYFVYRSLRTLAGLLIGRKTSTQAGSEWKAYFNSMVASPEGGRALW